MAPDEADPNGYGLQRAFGGSRIHCEAAPLSMLMRPDGYRVKTDRRERLDWAIAETATAGG